MKDPMIVASPRHHGGRRHGERENVWAALGWVGAVFLIVGGADFALTWLPPNFGSREWQFATVTQSFNGLPILVLGIGLLIGGAMQTDRRWWAHLAAVGAVAMFVWVSVGVVLWGMNVSLAMASVPPELVIGVQKAIAKTLIQSVVYAAILAYLAVRAFGAGRHA